MLNPRKNCLQAVIIALADRVELMIVTAGTVSRQPQKSRPGYRDHVVEVVHSLLQLALDRLVADNIVATANQESGSSLHQPITVLYRVAGQLLENKLRIWFVLIK